MKKLALVFSSLYLAGCAAVAQQPAPAPAPAAAAPVPMPVRPAPVLSEAEVFQQAVAELAGQLNQNMGRRAGQVFILTSFSDLNRLQESSHLGQLLSENLIHELQVRGWDLVELRLANAVSVNSAGEFGLSSGIVTQSLKYASDFQRRIRAGMTMVNLPTAGVDYHVPFGGTKKSSFGPREQGYAAADFYTWTQTAYVFA